MLRTKPSLLTILQTNPELHDVEEATTELNWIITETRAGITRGKGAEPDEDEVEREIEDRVRRRGRGEPIQYILGNTDFGPLRLSCRPPILIPRPETADVFGRLASLIMASGYSGSRATIGQDERGKISTNPPTKPPLKILDLYTGSGCIALLISHLLRTRYHPHLLGIDLDPLAIDLASENAASLVIPPSRARFMQGDIIHPRFPDTLRAEGWDQVDLVLANPPYIPLEEYEGLDPSVRGWEGKGALVGFERDGLGHYRALARMVRGLVEGKDEGESRRRTSTSEWDLVGLPRIAVEIGDGQGKEVERIFKDESEGGFIGRTECWRDGWGRERLVLGLTR